MNYSLIVRYSSLFLVGLMAGNSLAFVLGVGPAIRSLSAPAYIELHHSINDNFVRWTPVLYTCLLGIVGANLFVLRNHWRSMEFFLVLFTLICIFDEMFMMLRGNLPLHRMIQSWEAFSPPTNWSQIRQEWLEFMYLRAALLITGFSLLVLSCCVSKRFRTSQDVAVVF